MSLYSSNNQNKIVDYFPYRSPELYRYLKEKGFIFPSTNILNTSYNPYIIEFDEKDIYSLRFSGEYKYNAQPLPSTLEICNDVSASFPYLAYLDSQYQLVSYNLITHDEIILKNFTEPDHYRISVIDTDDFTYVCFACLEFGQRRLSRPLVLYDPNNNVMVYDSDFEQEDTQEPWQDVLAFFHIPKKHALGILQDESTATYYPKTRKFDFVSMYDFNLSEYNRAQLVVMDNTTFFIPYNPNRKDLESLFSKQDPDWEIQGSDYFSRKL